MIILTIRGQPHCANPSQGRVMSCRYVMLPYELELVCLSFFISIRD